MRALFFDFLQVAVFSLAVLTLCSGPVSADSHELTPAMAPGRTPVGSELTLDQAVNRALEMSPSIAAVASAVAAADARVEQAGLFPNPELELEFENFGGSEELDGFDAAESTAVISQSILLGGKRSRSRAVAESDHDLAGRDLDAHRLDVVAGAAAAFYRVLAAQEREALADELLSLAERSAGTVQARVDSGKVSPIDATRASIEVAQARVRLARAGRELQATRVLLAASWGSSTADFERVAGELPMPVESPDLVSLKGLLMEAPEIKRLEQQIERQQRIFDLEQSFRIPDLVVSVGPRRFEESGQTAWVAGLSLPIPIFDRNQGSRKAAEFELESRRRDAEAIRVRLEADLAATLERLHAAGIEATVMGRDVIPAAEAAFVATELGYREGKFGFLNVLDAQRSLFEVRSLFLDSREEYAITRTEIERLIGRGLTPSKGLMDVDRNPSQWGKR